MLSSARKRKEERQRALDIGCEPTVARRGVYWFRNLATVSYGSQRISFLSWDKEFRI